MEKKKQNQLERNRAIIRNIKLAYKNLKVDETVKINEKPGISWQTKRK
jgi:hypothetical protein